MATENDEAERRRPSMGEFRVGIGFNPSGDDTVSKIKRAAADLIDMISAIPDGGGTDESRPTVEIVELKMLAMRGVEDAAMWAVKAATKR